MNYLMEGAPIVGALSPLGRRCISDLYNKGLPPEKDVRETSLRDCMPPPMNIHSLSPDREASLLFVNVFISL